jgi:hypothetical protein
VTEKKPPSMPRLTADELHTLRSYLRTTVMRSLWSMALR